MPRRRLVLAFVLLLGLSCLETTIASSSSSLVEHRIESIGEEEAEIIPRCDLSLHEYIVHHQDREVERRATKAPTPQFPAVVLPNTTVVWIPIVFHVIIGKAPKNIGFIPRDVITQQIDAMNLAYSGAQNPGPGRDSGFRFILSGLNYYRNPQWFEACLAMEYKIKSTTSLDREGVINVWTCDMKSTGLGYATFPIAPGGSFQKWDQGIILDYRALLSSSSAPSYVPIPGFDLGDSLVHETGHYLGLFHTFENACFPPGDYIADTPPERQPYFGACTADTVRDTCKTNGDLLPDPIRNFMDYSQDLCMNQFTPMQISKMRLVVGSYRANVALMRLGLRCNAMAGLPGTAVGLSSCRETRCKKTRMPNGKMPPPTGWCHAVGLSAAALRRGRKVAAWGVCCCANDPSCPSMSKKGYSNFVSRSAVPSGRLLQDDDETMFDPVNQQICDPSNSSTATYTVAARICASSGARLCSLRELELKKKRSSCSKSNNEVLYWTMSFCRNKSVRVFVPSSSTTTCRPHDSKASVICCFD